jgi:hypothetical protein
MTASQAVDEWTLSPVRRPTLITIHTLTSRRNPQRSKIHWGMNFMP